MFSRLAGQVWVVADLKGGWKEAAQPLFLRFVGWKRSRNGWFSLKPTRQTVK